MTTARPIAPYLTAVAALVILGAAVLAVLPGRDSKVDFNAEIRPILNKKCLACHGGVRQRAELSFLFREDALVPAKSGLRAIVPGDQAV